MIKAAIRSALYGSTALVTMASAMSPAMAQETGALEEIIVTAARRSQPLSEVPSNLMAYDAETIDSLGIETFADLIRAVPGLVLANFDLTKGGWGGALPIMRGMNANKLAIAGPNVSAPTISTYYGNALLPLALNLADIERVEVLRGPQGTLYGSGSMAGTIQVVPASPDLSDTFLRVGGELSTTDNSGDPNYSAEGVLNLAATDSLGFRFVYGQRAYAGFIDEKRLVVLDGPNNAVKGPGFSSPGVPVGDLPSDPEMYWSKNDVNESQMDYLRAKILYEPTDWLTLEFSYDKQSFNSDGVAVDNPQFVGLDDYDSTARLLGPAERDLEVASFDIAADFGFATLAVNASEYDDEVEATRDWTSIARTYVGPFYFAPYGIPEPPRLQGTAFEFSSSSGDTYEVRLTSNGDQRFNWMGGIFHTKQKQNFENEYWFPGVTDYSDAVGSFWPFRPPYFPDAPGVPDDLSWEFIRDTEFKETSFFVDGDFSITDRWEIAGGVRFFKQEFLAKADSLLYTCNFYCSEDFTDPRGVHSVSTNQEFKDHVFRLSTNYRLTEDLRGYFNYAEGFRRGGANAVAVSGIFAEPPNLLTFEPDTVTSYELGLRGLLGEFSFTTDIYYMDWDGAQIEGLTPSGSWYAVVNAGSARNYGFDFETHGDLSENVTINVGYSYVNAKLAEDFSVPAAIRPSEGKKGDRMPGVPEHSFTASLDWRQPSLLGTWDGNFNINLAYRSDVWTDLESKNDDDPNTPDKSFLLGGFASVNSSYSVYRGETRFTLFVDNVFNERGVTATIPVAWAGDTVNASYGEWVMRPRTIGIKASYTF